MGRAVARGREGGGRDSARGSVSVTVAILAERYTLAFALVQAFVHARTNAAGAKRGELGGRWVAAAVNEMHLKPCLDRFLPGQARGDGGSVVGARRAARAVSGCLRGTCTAELRVLLMQRGTETWT